MNTVSPLELMQGLTERQQVRAEKVSDIIKKARHSLEPFMKHPVHAEKALASLTEAAYNAIASIARESEIEAEVETTEEAAETEVDLDTMKKADLIAFADEHGINLGEASKVAEIKAVIVDALAGE